MPKARIFFGRAKSWASKKGLFGPQAFFRYVVFTYVDCLAQETDDFVCKGGNLLWLYIHTPRQTVDLDLVTLKADTTAKVKELLESGCRRGNEKGVSFRLISLKEVSQQGERGASATMEYKTEGGAANTFDLDIVYVLPTEWKMLPSPIESDTTIRGATLEHVIVDKIATCHRFGGGNTRMKDFDDLWRISKSDQKIDWAKVKDGLARMKVPPTLDKDWINVETTAAWERHVKKYKDLPRDIDQVIVAVNGWLRANLS
ncbi:MAG: nucleotidyl transferase AbiEii/AbiGii toxin family protein [Deltaproteobacteria bacterium]|nr:nucleotidyl transferase AbiEii/AbiGii toxin family protein [Deltaproteobacteria bacterium]